MKATARLLSALIFFAFFLLVDFLAPPLPGIYVLRTQPDFEKEIKHKADLLESAIRGEAEWPLSASSKDYLSSVKSDMIRLAMQDVLQMGRKGIVSDTVPVGKEHLNILKVDDTYKKLEGRVFSQKEAVAELKRRGRAIWGNDARALSAYSELISYFMEPSLTVEKRKNKVYPWVRRIVFFLLILFAYLYMETIEQKNKGHFKKSLIIITNAAIVILATYFVINSGLSPFITLLPFFAIIANVTTGLSAALIFSVILSSILGIYFGYDFSIFLYGLLTSLTAIIATRNFGNRYQIYLVTFLVFVVALISSTSSAAFQATLTKNSLFKVSLAALITSLASGLLVIGLLPVIEKVFRISTDFLLLELSNLNNPLLRRLSVEAPGTFTHSILVGNLCEAAARRIGANPLLARVAAYYHDIGKLKNPEYFIENQIGKQNPHDLLPPEESARILKAHVTDGVEMAKKAGLPQEIIRVIQTHHGTSLITPFFKKAKEIHGDVNEEDFRYPGPKPETKEEAICMLADSVEAAARSMNELTLDKLRKLIDDIIESKVKDGQLDSTDLTRRELQEIEEAFFPVLQGVFHPRIEYPEEKKDKKDEDSGDKQPESTSDSG
ncbi:MAG: hypothetical protein DRQ06_00550 [Candidatus Hydrothermota bacterium]|nr:MAG: hypothetical protein DRQ06_00550 [Candidatus Hydrothermae bacterium]